MGTMLIDSVPPARMTSAWPTMIRSAAMAMACKPEEQNRLIVMAGTSGRQSGALAGDARDVHPRFALGHGAAEDHVVDVLGIKPRHPANRFQHGDGGKIIRPRRAQRALERFSYRRAN